MLEKLKAHKEPNEKLRKAAPPGTAETERVNLSEFIAKFTAE